MRTKQAAQEHKNAHRARFKAKHEECNRKHCRNASVAAILLLGGARRLSPTPPGEDRKGTKKTHTKTNKKQESHNKEKEKPMRGENKTTTKAKTTKEHKKRKPSSM